MGKQTHMHDIKIIKILIIPTDTYRVLTWHELSHLIVMPPYEVEAIITLTLWMRNYWSGR